MNGHVGTNTSSIPVLDLAWAEDPAKKPLLLKQLHAALFDVGFLYIINHDVAKASITHLIDLLPALFGLPDEEKAALSKLNSPHFLGYSGFAEETTLGKQDLREQFDFGTELPVVWQDANATKVVSPDQPSRSGQPQLNGHSTTSPDFTQLYWRLRGPNQWPSKSSIPGFRKAVTDYHDAVQDLSYRFVHLIEETLDMPVGTFDTFFAPRQTPGQYTDLSDPSDCKGRNMNRESLPPQHRIKLVRYPPSSSGGDGGQGVGAHKDSSGWLTFLYQVGHEEGLEVLSADGHWFPAPPIENSFVVNFGNAFEAATEGAVKATVHRVVAPKERVRYSIPFFQGLPLDMTVSEIRSYVPEHVRMEGKLAGRSDDAIATFLDPRWDSLGESQLRKWIRSHKDVGLKWYGREVVKYYTQ